jgi:hypothetical protein
MPLRMANPTPAVRIAKNPANNNRLALGAMAWFEIVVSATMTCDM